MSWLWPGSPHPQSTVLIRAGRVLHWTALAIAVSLAIVGISNLGGMDPEGMRITAAIFAAALAIALFGRGIRYVLSNE